MFLKNVKYVKGISFIDHESQISKDNMPKVTIIRPRPKIETESVKKIISAWWAKNCIVQIKSENSLGNKEPKDRFARKKGTNSIR